MYPRAALALRLTVAAVCGVVVLVVAPLACAAAGRKNGTSLLRALVWTGVIFPFYRMAGGRRFLQQTGYV